MIDTHSDKKPILSIFIKIVLGAVLFLFIQGEIMSQNDIPLPKNADDSLRLIPGDTTKVFDSFDTNKDKKKKKEKKEIPAWKLDHSPKKATRLSAIFPGLGQIYNRKYWKLPIIYGGFTGLIVAERWNNARYEDYKQAYSDIIDDDPESDSYLDLLAPGTDPESIDLGYLEDVIENKRINFRRDRDFMRIMMGLAYVLQIIDANVDAHLMDFDISDDLTLHLEPTFSQNSNLSKSFGVKMHITF